MNPADVWQMLVFFRSWRASVWIFPMMQQTCPSTGPRTDTPTSSPVSHWQQSIMGDAQCSKTLSTFDVSCCAWWKLSEPSSGFILSPIFTFWTPMWCRLFKFLSTFPPDDFSRVKLMSMHNDEGSDYINANYIPVSVTSAPGSQSHLDLDDTCWCRSQTPDWISLILITFPATDPF